MNPLGEKTLNLPPVKSVIMIKPRSYKVGDIIIPSDIKLFNRMWLNKEFDKIHPKEFDIQCVPTMYRGHNSPRPWDITFFTERKRLTHMTAAEMWETSIYSLKLKMEVYKILHTINPLERINIEFAFPVKMVENYLSAAPETLMFTENKPFAYKNSRILPIYRDLIARFQLLGNKTNDERISIYLHELRSISEKIRFIQMLSYYGLESTILKFKRFKNNQLECDPEITEIMADPTLHLGFWKTSFKRALYDFYSLCVSPEKETEDNMKNVRLIGTTIIHYEDIRRLVSCYLLPMRSSIKQDKLHTISCQVIFSYLGPSFITRQYIVAILTM
jgi:hypothetical protein